MSIAASWFLLSLLSLPKKVSDSSSAGNTNAPENPCPRSIFVAIIFERVIIRFQVLKHTNSAFITAVEAEIIVFLRLPPLPIDSYLEAASIGIEAGWENDDFFAIVIAWQLMGDHFVHLHIPRMPSPFVARGRSHIGDVGTIAIMPHGEFRGQ